MTIIEIIIKSYSTILISVGLGALTIFSLGVYFIIKKSNHQIDTIDNAECLPFHVFNENETSDIHVSETKMMNIEEFKKYEYRSPMRDAKTMQIGADLSDLSAIAGDDIITTQLDLAHACIESGREKMAIQILKRVIEQGNANEQKEAKRLLTFLTNKTTVSF
jgi:FimV-like protein